MNIRAAVRITLLAAGAAGTFATAHAQESAKTGASGLQLEEVVVTAQRRQEQIQDVPIAVSAFDQTEMQRRQAFNVVDIVSNVPNLVGNNNIGQGTATTVFLRGIGSTESIVTLETALGFYIDDVYISRQGVNNLSLYDVERIEVLRGPQGTLYGRNTTGGALRVITAKPQDETSGSMEASYGEYNRWSLKGSVNVPLSDTLYVRGGAFVEQGDGYSDNQFNGKEVNDRDGYGGRVAMRWVPNDRFEGTLSLDYYKSDQAGLYPSDRAGIIRPSTNSLFTVNSGVDTSNIGRTYGASLTLNFDLSDALQLQSITGFRNVYQEWNLDLSDQPEPVFTLYTVNDTDSYSQEFKLNGKAADDRLQYTAGIFFYKEDNFSFIGDEINLWFPGPARVPLPFFGRNYDMDVTSYAVFAEGQFALTPKLSLIAGGRYTHDEKDLTIDARVGGVPGTEMQGGVTNYNNDTLNALGTPTDLDYNKFTPKVGLQYYFTDDVNAYLTYSQGWKSGGWSARTNNPSEFVVFDPETVNSYELGLKTTVGGGRARLNYTAFYYDYKDFFSTATGQTGNFIVFTSDAEFYGLEFEGTVRVTDQFDAFATLGWEKGSYKDFDKEVFGTSIGEEPQRMPEFTAKIGGTQKWPIASGEILLTADYQFLEDHYTNLQNSELARSGNINLVNVLLGYEFAEGKYLVSLACRNCADDSYISQTLDFSGIAPNSKTFDPSAPGAFNGLNFLTAYAGPPREWLVTFKAKF